MSFNEERTFKISFIIIILIWFFCPPHTELTEQSDLDIVLFTETRLVLSLDLRWIISLEWPGLTSVIFAFEMASCARTSVCNSLLYSLTADGILCMEKKRHSMPNRLDWDFLSFSNHWKKVNVAFFIFFLPNT